MLKVLILLVWISVLVYTTYRLSKFNEDITETFVQRFRIDERRAKIDSLPIDNLDTTEEQYFHEISNEEMQKRILEVVVPIDTSLTDLRDTIQKDNPRIPGYEFSRLTKVSSVYSDAELGFKEDIVEEDMLAKIVKDLEKKIQKKELLTDYKIVIFSVKLQKQLGDELYYYVLDTVLHREGKTHGKHIRFHIYYDKGALFVEQADVLGIVMDDRINLLINESLSTKQQEKKESEVLLSKEVLSLTEKYQEDNTFLDPSQVELTSDQRLPTDAISVDGF